MILKAILASLAMLPATFGAGMARADDQGWDGPGWYISSGLQATATVPAAYILFNGPHAGQPVCMEVYNRLYSPIGNCRYLDLKPGLSQPITTLQR